jgi:hypothetical protein
MANWHLDELLIELIGAGWKRMKTLPGKHAGIAGIWQMVQPSTNRLAFVEFHVELDEAPDENTAELLNSYGCAVRYNPNIALHFYKKRPHWDEHLKQFVSGMNELEARLAAPEACLDELEAEQKALVLTA